MLKNLLFYFKLSFFCLKLALGLVLFSLEFGFSKLSSKKSFSYLLIVLIFLSLGLNLILWKEKNTEKIITIKIEQNLENKKAQKREAVIVDKNELVNLKNWHLSLSEKQGIKNQQIYLNLSELSKIENNSEKTQQYLILAQEIFSL